MILIDDKKRDFFVSVIRNRKKAHILNLKYFPL